MLCLLLCGLPEDANLSLYDVLHKLADTENNASTHCCSQYLHTH